MKLSGNHQQNQITVEDEDKIFQHPQCNFLPNGYLVGPWTLETEGRDEEAIRNPCQRTTILLI